ILIVALLIIPAVTARFWTERSAHVIWIAGALGAVSGYFGAVLSASLPDVPTGPIIVLVAAGLFVISLLFSPHRGVIAALVRHRTFQARVHRRQGLLALAAQHPIREAFTLRLLTREGLVRADGVVTENGRALAAKVARDERRWEIAREIHQDAGLTGRYDGLTPIEEVFTADEIAEFDSRIGPPVAVGGA
ncbi:MAG: metal ABC transporter permease, partial [Pseudomonadota bacterium]